MSALSASPLVCALSALLLGVLFVASFLVCCRSFAHLPRDAPASVAARLTAVFLVCLLAPAPLLLLLPPQPPLLRRMGVALECNGVSSFAGPLVLVGALFAGPLVEAALLGGACRRAPAAAAAAAAAAPSPPAVHLLLRAYVAAPLFEEWVFRACALPLWLGAGVGAPAAALLSAAVFGGAHAHHYWEKRRLGAPHAAALAGAAVMVAYTSAFGAIEALAFLRWGSFGGVAAAHALANWMGLPPFAFAAGGRAPLWRRAAAGCAYAAGVAAFAYLCTPAGGRWWARAVAPAPCAATAR